MIEPGKMIEVLRKKRGLSQGDLAKKIHVTKQTISNYETSKRMPDVETLEKIADALGVPMSSLVSRDDQRETINSIYGFAAASPNVIRVPILGTITAGIPINAVEDVLDWEELPISMARGGKEFFGLRIRGDSMAPEYRNGDTIILRKQETCESGQDCAVMVNNEDATFKRVRITDGGIVLMPINPAYEPKFYTSSEVDELPVRILGVVIQLRRNI